MTFVLAPLALRPTISRGLPLSVTPHQSLIFDSVYFGLFIVHLSRTVTLFIFLILNCHFLLPPSMFIFYKINIILYNLFYVFSKPTSVVYNLSKNRTVTLIIPRQIKLHKLKPFCTSMFLLVTVSANERRPTPKSRPSRGIMIQFSDHRFIFN